MRLGCRLGVVGVVHGCHVVVVGGLSFVGGMSSLLVVGSFVGGGFVCGWCRSFVGGGLMFMGGGLMFVGGVLSFRGGGPPFCRVVIRLCHLCGCCEQGMKNGQVLTRMT